MSADASGGCAGGRDASEQDEHDSLVSGGGERQEGNEVSSSRAEGMGVGVCLTYPAPWLMRFPWSRPWAMSGDCCSMATRTLQVL